jgi:trans-aconitate methyltransferase
MLKVSQKLNPECKHIKGDMRSIRLEQKFDVVFIHDAIAYMTTLHQLKQAIDTAYIHCKQGGLALFVPDWTAENFKPTTSHGGHEGKPSKSSELPPQRTIGSVRAVNQAKRQAVAVAREPPMTASLEQLLLPRRAG